MPLKDGDDCEAPSPIAAAVNLDSARRGFERLISEARAQDNKSALGYLLQSLGDMEARAGNTERAVLLHEEALTLDPASPLPILVYAQGLARSFKRPEEALAKLMACAERNRRLDEDRVLVQACAPRPKQDRKICQCGVTLGVGDDRVVPMLFKIAFGVIPACLLTLTGLVFANFISTTYQAMLLVSGLIGTCGLIWSLMGHSRKTAPLVLVMLFIGMTGVLVGGIAGAISALVTDAHNRNLGSPVQLTLRVVAVAWLTLGPAVIGSIQARRAVRVLRGSASE